MHDMITVNEILYIEQLMKNLSQTKMVKDQMSTSMNQYLGGMHTTYFSN